MSSQNPRQIQNLLIHAVLAAKKAGEAIMEVYGSSFSVEHKEDHSPLTLADRRAHESIADHLTMRAGASLPLLSEEGRNIPYGERKGWGYYWLVDPLDGTKEFVKRNGEFTVNIALMQKDRPLMGVILIPVKDVLYFAAEEKGSFKVAGTSRIKDGLSFGDLIQGAVRLPERADRSTGIFTAIASRSHPSDETSSFLEELKKEHGEVRIISAGSSLKFCLIAEGSADIYPRFAPTMEWDTAAGQAIVEQAGGTVIQYARGEPLRYNKENLVNPWFIVRGT
jgi:3'(2'), 5'-bisphosphate nucleotidase